MRYLLSILFSWTYFFSQDIQIRIPDEKPLVIRQMEHHTICFTIENSSVKKYALVFDQNGFNSISNEVIDPPFLGLPFFRIYKGQEKLKGEYGSSPYDITPREHIEKEELKKYKKKSTVTFNHPADLSIAYEINKRMIFLEPKEIKPVCMNISLPLYNSDADSGSLSYDLHEDEAYFFQIFLPVPADILKKYVSESDEIFDDYTLFSGTIESDKIPFVYK